MLSILKHNGCLGILPDLRHCTPSSVMVDFMGIPALTAVGVATMALHADCPVVPRRRSASWRSRTSTCSARFPP
jgi:lauroyl/myristoyl acyltransferase